jgi:two-component system chemotaxis response regulator CheY
MAHTVLIIDDSSTMRKIVTRSLRQAGLSFDNILEATDGQHALQVLAQEKVDIILSDINMPVMDGMTFLKEKAAIDTLKDIPVVMISTESAADIINEAMELGAAGSIKKPFTPDMITKTISPLL